MLWENRGENSHLSRGGQHGFLQKLPSELGWKDEQPGRERLGGHGTEARARGCEEGVGCQQQPTHQASMMSSTGHSAQGGLRAAQLPCRDRRWVRSPGLVPPWFSQVLLTRKPGFCPFPQMIVFPDKNTMFSHCSALRSSVPDRRNDDPGQPLNPDALHGSVAKTAPVLKTAFADS